MIGPGSYEIELNQKMNRMQEMNHNQQLSKLSRSSEKYGDDLKYKRIIPGPGNYELNIGVY